MQDTRISLIKIGDRHRKDLGDIDALAASIEAIGLLQPIGIDSNYRLIFGERRLRACMKLGRETIPARIVHVPSLLLAEHAENEIRKDFTPSERVAIGQAMEEALGNRRGQRTDLKPEGQGELLEPEHVENFPQVETGEKTRQIAAKQAGFGNETTYRQAKTVVQNAEPELVQAMDSGAVSISTAAKLATAPVEVQKAAAIDPKKAVELAKQASARKEKDIQEGSKTIRAAKKVDRHSERVERIAEISQGNTELNLEQRYPVIYADPPWRYEHVETESRAIENQYPTMLLDDICALPVAELATPDAILFLWATSPKLAESLRVIESWGFTYRTCAVWDKCKIGMGYYFRQQHELLLVATRGAMPAPLENARPPWSVYAEARGEHSAKPSRFAEIIEGMYPSLPRIELFCRSPRDGWAVWGNQSNG